MIDIRDATLEDSEAIRAIYNDAVLNTTAVFDYTAREPQAQRDWMAMKADQNLPVLVAVDGAAVVGYSSFGQFRPWPAFLYCVENAIYIAPDRRGQGIGQKLLTALVAVAAQRGLRSMVAAITAENAASLHLHEKLGFTRTGLIRDSGWKFDRWLDLVFLQRMLQS
ncbi:N-acetyltransferase family protein [Ferrovibrio terrae]|uniref:GNAT family N-acetyltransferase n=1 Tax=Ferrovibrio terrae TaxID=2594003 RepID=UPI003137FCD9